MLGAAGAALSLSACGPATLAEQWDGTSWTINTTTNPQSWQYATLHGASCTAASACMAVGFYETGNAAASLSEQWDGASWTVQPVPPPDTQASPTQLLGVSCTSATACTAVGYYGLGGANFTVAERWDGTTWTVQTTPQAPLPNLQSADLRGVSCTSATACTAVGDTLATGAGQLSLTLAEVWDGTSWTVQPTPNPAGSAGTILTGVSCTSATACTAVGSYQTNPSASSAVPFAERWDGQSWTIQTIPNPATSMSTFLDGLSCTSATACTAVGFYLSATYPNGLQLAERWDGTSWTIQATPQQGSQLHGVSCTSATACTAVGSYVSSTGGPPLAEVWDGTSWTAQAIPNQPGKTSSILNAVSCTSVSACAAVGNWFQ